MQSPNEADNGVVFADGESWNGGTPGATAVRTYFPKEQISSFYCIETG